MRSKRLHLTDPWQSEKGLLSSDDVALLVEDGVDGAASENTDDTSTETSCGGGVRALFLGGLGKSHLLNVNILILALGP